MPSFKEGSFTQDIQRGTEMRSGQALIALSSLPWCSPAAPLLAYVLLPHCRQEEVELYRLPSPSLCAPHSTRVTPAL